ncbi:MAG: type II toxin-antitoxin system Phd/YefM family antitoxin [Candidatus Limnocylindrales bacterium]
MSEGARRQRVGIRELRQNLSIYVDRVKDGETLEVTEHGNPVAHLGPIASQTRSQYEEMVADGRMAPPKRAVADIPPPIRLPAEAEPLSVTLQRLRDEETT